MHEPVERWGLILAGGEGTRLRPLTRVLSGDDRPKQFCPLLGSETLLGRTRRRAALLLPEERTLTILTRHHQSFYAPLLPDLPAGCALVQPENRGTAAAILYGLFRITAVTPMASVVVLPVDHWVSDDGLFMCHAAAALTAVAERPDLVILLGIAPDAPETEYGWIEPGEALPVQGLRRVRRFWEKPGLGIATRLLETGCLWNTFVIVARVPALLALIRLAVPALYRAFDSVRWDPEPDGRALGSLYRDVPSTSLSDHVLGARPANLTVLPVNGVRWSDWGRPRRVLDTLAQLGVRPAWTGSRITLSA